MATRRNTPASNLEREREQILATVERHALSASASDNAATRAQEERDLEVEHLRIDVENRREKRARRTKWDKVLTRLVVAGFVLSYVMIAGIGFHILTFPDSSFAVPSVVAVGIVQTYGLAKLAVKYFFSDDDRYL